MLNHSNISTIVIYWLVVDLPLWKIWKSVGMMKFPIYGNSPKKSSKAPTRLVVIIPRHSVGISRAQDSAWLTSMASWLVVEPPLWKISVRQLGWWNSQYHHNIYIWALIKFMFQTTNQSWSGHGMEFSYNWCFNGTNIYKWGTFSSHFAYQRVYTIHTWTPKIPAVQKIEVS